MAVNDLVLVQGMASTKATLRRWNAAPVRTLAPWLGLAFAIALALLLAVYAVARLSTPDPTPYALPGYTRPAGVGDVGSLLFRNGLVLALHALACVAGFIAGSSLPLSASRRAGLDRWVHEKAGPLAIGFVMLATAFSLLTQAYLLGTTAASLSYQLAISPAALALTLLPHALPELTALFLPLAAWTLASRAGRWDELLAATAVTVGIAVPVLVMSAAIELWAWPEILTRVAGPSF